MESFARFSLISKYQNIWRIKSTFAFTSEQMQHNVQSPLRFKTFENQMQFKTESFDIKKNTENHYIIDALA